MKRCLLCGKKRLEAGLYDLLFSDDPLCEECRKGWCKEHIVFMLDGVRVESDYIYNDAFANALVQFKELKDEALKDVFLYGLKGRIRRKYRGYTLCLLPSSEEKLRERGFSHLKAMYEGLGMKIMEPFEKIDNSSQKNKSGKEREMMKDNIRLKEDVVLPEKILLVDDTITTGSSIIGALSCIEGKHTVRIYSVSYNRKWNLEKR